MRSPLQQWKFNQLRQCRIAYLYHLTHIDNLPSILANGLQSWSTLHEAEQRYTDISEQTVQSRRKARRVRVAHGRSRYVHEMVPLFLRPLTPMLYARREEIPNLCFILVNSSYVTHDDVECVVCDGNAASQDTRTAYSFGKDGAFLKQLPWQVLNASSWTEFPDGSRKRSAEFLVWPSIPPSAFWKIVVKRADAQKRVEFHVRSAGKQIPCEILPDKFF